MALSDLGTRINTLLSKAHAVLKGGQRDSSGTHWLNPTDKAEVRAASLSFLERVFGKESAYYTNFESATRSQLGSHFETAVGILKAAKDEIDGGWLITARGLLSAEIFADYLAMADHLMEEGYKDPAAVIAGSTLEEHLRQLCVRSGIPTESEKDGRQVPVKADRLNAELARHEVYSKLDQKSVTTWLDLRNKAAHGKYTEYSAGQVEIMVPAIREFIARNPV